MPRETGSDLLETRVDRIGASIVRARCQQHASDDAAVTIVFLPDDEDRLAVGLRSEMLARSCAISLSALGCVDAGETNPVLPVGFVEKSECVAVGDAGDGAVELRRARRCGGDEPYECNARETRADSGLLGPRLCGGVQKSTRTPPPSVLRFVGSRPRALSFPHNINEETTK
jgi:hypothetical protein